MHNRNLLTCLSIALISATPLLAQGQGKKFFGQGNPFTTEELPNGELKTKLKKLKPQARIEALKRLHSFSFPDSDAAKHLRLDDNGGVFIVCPINGCDHGCDDHTHGHEDAGSIQEGNTIATENAAKVEAENIPIGDGTNETFNPTSSVPVSSPPTFNSKPGAPFHIYLDFNGAYVTGKQWTYSDGTTTWSTWDCAAWSTDTDPANFSISEQNDIRRMWERIAEDYAPFNVNVTTDAAYDPDNYTGDKNKVGWLLTTPTTDKNGVRCPHYSYGGVAYVNVFGRSDFFSRYQPAWVTPMGTANTAEAASHEMGHNLGLSHDGLTTGAAYYGGHVATSSAPSWGPIMGTGYNRNVSQWSRAIDYFNGNQTQDDLTIIAGKLTNRTDDHGDTFPTATPWTQVPVNQSGIVERTDNTDVFTFTTGAGTVSFNAATYRCDTQTWGGNLDIALELYNSSQTLVASANPAAEINASLSASVPAGTYYLVLKPSAAGSPLATTPSGYTTYGSLGFYNITGNFNPVGTIFLSAPNGGETWFVGTSQNITWSSGLSGNVKIELFKNGSLNSTISTNTPNDGSFLWSLPPGQQSGSDYKIKITSIENSAISAESFANFSIETDPLATALDNGYTWATSGNLPWFFQSTTTNDGIDAAQSGAIDHNQSSSLQTTIVGPGTMTFWWSVSSESGYDFLRFSINDVEQTGDLARISGNVSWVQKTVAIPAGSHTVKWSYTKDGSVVAGSDSAWVDQVTFTPTSIPGSLDITPAGGLASSGTIGGSFSPSSLQFTLSNPGDSSINWTAVNTQSWVTLSSASGTLAAGANATVTATINGSALNAGDYSDTVTFTNTSNGTGNTTRPISLTVNKASQTINFAALAPVPNNSAPFALTATASSGLAVSYTSSNSAVATVSGNTVTIVAPGNTTITASQAGNANYNPANSVSQTLTVAPANTAPAFINNPIVLANASENTAYTGQTLAGQATDPGDTITYSKVSGPAWLVIASNGALSGTPPSGSTGLNSFIVRATDTSSATADATLEITVTGLPLPWISTDIGTGMLAGSTSFNAGIFTQAGSGAIGSKSDRFRYTYQTLTGDGEIIARISNLQNTGTSSRVGVMIRDSLAANSKEIFMGMTGSNAYRWARRTATNGNTTTSNSSTGTVPNTWVRLVRSGTTITAYTSTNGTTWTTVGSTTGTTFASTCYIGLAVASGSTTTLNTSQFSNVSVTP